MGTEKCNHSLVEEDHTDHNGSVVIRYKCSKCNLIIVEKYDFSEGYEITDTGVERIKVI